MTLSMSKSAYYLFLFCLVFSPLAFGTVEQWSLVTIECITAVSCLLFFLHAWYHQKSCLKVTGLVPLTLLLVLAVVQLVPLPVPLVRFLSPGTYEVYAPVLAMLDADQWIPLSLNRQETIFELLRLTSYAMFYVLTVQMLSHPARLKRTINIVVFLGGAIAILAIIQRVSSPDKIYWFRTLPANANPFGPWVNSNQFCGFMELVFPLILALFLFYRPRVKDDESFREKLVSIFTVPGVHLHIFLGFGAVMILLSVFVSLCRGGILSITVAIVTFLYLYNRKFPKKGRGTLLMVFCCFFFMVSWFGWDTILAEFNQSFDDSGNFSDGRLSLWADCLKIIKTFPFFGAGFGTFLSIYPSYKTIESDLIYDHAHNDYLELFTDGGLIGFLLASWFIVSVLWQGWRMIRARRDKYSILLGTGAISGIVALLAHSVTDFNLHNGAVGLYFFFTCGVLSASVNCRFDYFSPGSLLPKLAPEKNIWFAGLAAAVFLIISVIQFGVFLGGYKYAHIKNVYINKQLSVEKLEKIAETMKIAQLAAPFEGLYTYKLGSVLWYLNDPASAIQLHAAAALKNPLDGIFLQQLGLLRGDEKDARLLIDEGYRRALHKQTLVVNYAEWLLWKGQRGEALTVLRSRLEQDYRQVTKLMPMLNSYEISQQELLELLPHDVDTWLYFGSYCEANRTLEEATFFFGKALDFLPSTESIDSKWFKQVIHFHRRHGQDAEALEVIRKAVERVPEDAELHILLGDHYLNEGITYRAKEEYERALVIDPGNRQARSELRRMGFEDSY